MDFSKKIPTLGTYKQLKHEVHFRNKVLPESGNEVCSEKQLQTIKNKNACKIAII